MIDIFFFCIIGVLAGLVSGLLGLGGGIIIVPGLVEWMTQTAFSEHHVMQLSIGTSLSVMTMTALWSGLLHHRKGAVRWSVVKLLAPGMVVGVIIGVQMADWLPSLWLKKFFALILLVIAFQLLLFPKPVQHEGHVRTWQWPIIGLLIGALAGMIGLGGGLLVVPLLLFNGVPMVNASAVALWCTLPTVVVGTGMAVYTGFHEPHLPAMSLGYVYWPATLGVGLFALIAAPLGVRLAHKLDRVKMQRFFAFVLCVISLRMIVG